MRGWRATLENRQRPGELWQVGGKNHSHDLYSTKHLLSMLPWGKRMKSQPSSVPGWPIPGSESSECVIGQAQITGSQPGCTRSQRGDKVSSLLPAVMGDGKNTSICREGEAVSQEETKVLLGKGNGCWATKNGKYSLYHFSYILILDFGYGLSSSQSVFSLCEL